jgi:hypothetical protein
MLDWAVTMFFHYFYFFLKIAKMKKSFVEPNGQTADNARKMIQKIKQH